MDISKLLDLRFFRRLLFRLLLAELLSLCCASCDEFSLVDNGIPVGVLSAGSLLISCAEEEREVSTDVRSLLEHAMPVGVDGLGGAAVDAEVEGGTCSEALRFGCCVDCVGTKSEYRREIGVTESASALDGGPGATW
jgi:hypothetical protein